MTYWLERKQNLVQTSVCEKKLNVANIILRALIEFGIYSKPKERPLSLKKGLDLRCTFLFRIFYSIAEATLLYLCRVFGVLHTHIKGGAGGDHFR